MENVLLVVQLIVAVALVTVILFQRTAQDGGGLVGGSSTMGGLFTARGSANLLTRTTAVLATIFILNSLALGYLASSQHRSHSMLDQIMPQQQQAPVVPGVPKPAPTSTAPAPVSPLVMPPAATPAPVPKQSAPAVPSVPLPKQ